MIAIGIDIGTTKICISAVESETGAVIQFTSVKNDAAIISENTWEKAQDPKMIIDTVESILKSYRDKYPVNAIGITGQMHGILYVNKYGNAVSPLYTWQDGRGDIVYKQGNSYVDHLSRQTQYKLATGYGAVTHYYNEINRLISEDARCFCTIHDYLAMKLTGRTEPVTHISDAASVGLFDLRKVCFDQKAIEKAGMDYRFFPKVTDDLILIGEDKKGIPVTAAIGDNQASFMGSVKDIQGGMLINVGTGSQISIHCSCFVEIAGIEIRPYIKGEFLLVGSPLCGGKSYAVLEEFYRSIVEMAGYKCENLYERMNDICEQYENISNKLSISTKFCGSRENPSERGSVHNIGLHNFTPKHLTIGILEGIVEELYENYERIKDATDIKPELIIGSGNGIKKNDVLKAILENKFGVDVAIPAHQEEAAYGAALSAMVVAGWYKNIGEAQKIISYQERKKNDIV